MRRQRADNGILPTLIVAQYNTARGKEPHPVVCFDVFATLRLSVHVGLIRR